MMQANILTDSERAILSVERERLTQLQVALARFPASEQDRATLAQSVRQLDELGLVLLARAPVLVRVEASREAVPRMQVASSGDRVGSIAALLQELRQQPAT